MHARRNPQTLQRLEAQEVNRWNSTLKVSKNRLRRTSLSRGTTKLRPVRKTEPHSEAWMKALLTRLFSEFIRARDPICYCGQPSTENGHYFSRAVPSTEYDEDNCLGSCSACNYLHETDKEPMKRALIARIGEERFAELETRHWDHAKLTFEELEDLLERYRA
jgi:hypothetical protein